jgi:peptidoglycan/xylan/chitin deacetylase (PgdA/CDA1 family)
LHASGIGIGSHTVSHPDLRLLSDSALDYELTRSKQAIEDAIGDAVRSFAYPYAFPETDRGFVRRLADVLEKRGYEVGVSTIIGTAQRGDNRFFLPRLPINIWDDPQFFQAKLEGGYDWLHTAQYLLKTIKCLDPRRPHVLCAPPISFT